MHSNCAALASHIVYAAAAGVHMYHHDDIDMITAYVVRLIMEHNNTKSSAALESHGIDLLT